MQVMPEKRTRKRVCDGIYDAPSMIVALQVPMFSAVIAPPIYRARRHTFHVTAFALADYYAALRQSAAYESPRPATYPFRALWRDAAREIVVASCTGPRPERNGRNR